MRGPAFALAGLGMALAPSAETFRAAAANLNRFKDIVMPPRPRRLPIRTKPGWDGGGVPSKGRNSLNRKRLAAWRAYFNGAMR
jgi:hypothetical protein